MTEESSHPLSWPPTVDRGDGTSSCPDYLPKPSDSSYPPLLAKYWNSLDAAQEIIACLAFQLQISTSDAYSVFTNALYRRVFPVEETR